MSAARLRTLAFDVENDAIAELTVPDARSKTQAWRAAVGG